jgi:oligoribonuclease NrnB/cAMP/cGMP phosphodiesterase (DHH superfamily)
MKVKLFTHTDFDGIGCGILGKLAFGENIDIEYCNYDDINERVSEFILNSKRDTYNKVFITDISVNEDIAEALDTMFLQYDDFKLLDHHPTALELNKYKWANVEIMLNENEKTSGTRMFYDYILNNVPHKTRLNVSNIFDFVETVRKYDTWQWKAENDLTPKQWNDLLYIMGREEFIESIIYRLKSYDVFDFCSFDDKLLQYEQRKIDKYIESKNKEIIVKDILGYKAGVIFGEQYHSELGNKLCELHSELDFIVIISMSKAVSYRSIGNKVNLGKDIASVYFGGGHPNSSGSPISDEIRINVIDMLFDK